MTPQELKSSILQLAVQGKLVEQRAEEGTAEELFRQIQEEKQRLIKEGKIKKEKPLPAITEDEIPFDIPESWKWVRLGTLSSLVTKGTTPRGGNVSYCESGIGFLRAENVAGLDKLNKSNLKFIDINTHIDYLKRSIIKSNDVLITIAGTLGRTAIVREEDIPLNANQAVAIVRLCVVEFINLLYLIFALNSSSIQKYLTTQRKVTAIPNLTLEIIENCVFPLPPLAEQKRIVAKIEELLPYVDRYEKAWSKLEDFNKRFPADMQKSVLQMAIQGKLVEQRPEEGTAEELYTQIQAEKQQLIKEGKIKKEKPLSVIAEDEIPFDIPENWKWVRFKDICSVLTCGYASTPQYVSSTVGYPFLSAKNVKPYRFLPENHNCISKELYLKLIQNAKPEKGDILLTRVGAGIGEAAIIDKDFDFAIYVSLTLIKLVDNSMISNQYILFWLNSPIGVSSAKKNIYGKNASQGNLNVKNVREFLLPLPPFAEQKRIVQKLDEILPLCDKLK